MFGSEEWFTQGGYRVRLEWGRRGAQAAAARGDVLVVVDVLSFSSAAVTATAQGVTLYPVATQDEARETALQVGAVVAVRREEVPDKGRYSLSPISFLGAETGARVVVASPNGATCSRYGRTVPRLYIGSLLNAASVARAVTQAMQETTAAVTILACGERWQEPSEDGELRFALEDYLGGGAIIAHLPPDLPCSPEARAAVAVFQDAFADLEAVLLGCGSGIELVGKGYRDDVTHAARLNFYDAVPVLCDGERLEAANF
jgi:2-phosphosulfolactate phosphatase